MSGVSGEANTIRIGTVVPADHLGKQTATYIAGIFGATLAGGAEVFVNAAGQLGTVKSSARYKHDVHDMGEASHKLMKLRPVVFRYNSDQSGTLQYGLIAEEVAKVYPELVVNGADGKPETVAYHMLPVMLLNEAQQQARELAYKDAQIQALQGQIAAQQQQIGAIAARLDVLERQARALQPDRLVAAMR
jgi:trimeric autotransporter adhesin